MSDKGTNCLDGQTLEFARKLLEVIPRGILANQFDQLKSELRELTSFWSDDQLRRAVLGAIRGTHQIVPIKHTVDLGKSPRLPFDGAEVVKHEASINGKKIVEVELRSDDNLYVDGLRVSLYLSERQIGNKTVQGYELRQELEDGSRVLLNSNVLDYLWDHPELFPEHWKKNEQGKTLYIYFWGSIFRRPSNGRLYVRHLCWHDDEPSRFYSRLGGDWDRQFPSAVLAS